VRKRGKGLDAIGSGLLGNSGRPEQWGAPTNIFSPCRGESRTPQIRRKEQPKGWLGRRSLRVGRVVSKANKGRAEAYEAYLLRRQARLPLTMLLETILGMKKNDIGMKVAKGYYIQDQKGYSRPRVTSLHRTNSQIHHIHHLQHLRFSHA
jgi:hypothetical protein